MAKGVKFYWIYCLNMKSAAAHYFFVIVSFCGPYFGLIMLRSFEATTVDLMRLKLHLQQFSLILLAVDIGFVLTTESGEQMCFQAFYFLSCKTNCHE